MALIILLTVLKDVEAFSICFHSVCLHVCTLRSWKYCLSLDGFAEKKTKIFYSKSRSKLESQLRSWLLGVAVLKVIIR